MDVAFPVCGSSGKDFGNTLHVVGQSEDVLSKFGPAVSHGCPHFSVGRSRDGAAGPSEVLLWKNCFSHSFGVLGCIPAAELATTAPVFPLVGPPFLPFLLLLLLLRPPSRCRGRRGPRLARAALK